MSCGGNHTRGEADSRMDLDPTLWKRLSPELLDLVLSKLQYVDLMRLRFICKDWNAKIVSHAFPRPLNHAPKCLLAYYKDVPQGLGTPLTIYNPSSQVWQKLTLGFLDCIDIASARLVGSGGGLLVFCGASRADGRPYHLRLNQLIVCNPLTKVYQKVQLSGLIAPSCMGVICQLEDYQLILIGKEECYGNRPRIYSSLTQSWRRGARAPIEHACLHGCLAGAVICSGSFYCILGASPYRHKVLGYQPDKDSWRAIDRPSYRYYEAGLAEHQGRLLLLAVTGKGDICIYTLVEDNDMKWEILKSILCGVGLLGRRPRFSPAYWHVCGEGNVIYLFGFGRREVDGRAQSVALNLQRDSWRWLYTLEGENPHPHDFFTFKPSLEVLSRSVATV